MPPPDDLPAQRGARGGAPGTVPRARCALRPVVRSHGRRPGGRLDARPSGAHVTRVVPGPGDDADARRRFAAPRRTAPRSHRPAHAPARSRGRLDAARLRDLVWALAHPGAELTRAGRLATASVATGSTSSRHSRRRGSNGSGAGSRRSPGRSPQGFHRPPDSWCRPGLFDRRALRAAARDATSAATRRARPDRARRARYPTRRRRSPAPSSSPRFSYRGDDDSRTLGLAPVPRSPRAGRPDVVARIARRSRTRGRAPAPARLARAAANRSSGRHSRSAASSTGLASRSSPRSATTCVPADSTAERFRAVLKQSGVPRATLLVTLWGQHPASAWRDAVRLGIGQSERWCFCLTGPRLRIVDSTRTYSRQFVEFDLEIAIENEETFAVLWGLLRAAAMAGSGDDPRPLLDRAIELTERASRVGPDLTAAGCARRAGAPDAGVLGGRPRDARRPPAGRTRQARTRSPRSTKRWSSSIGSSSCSLPRRAAWCRAGIRSIATATPSKRCADRSRCWPRPVGVWEALQAIARLAQRGCRIGALRVPPFNGRLFSPAHAPLADRVPLDDRVVRPGAAGVDDPPGARRIRAHRVRRPRRRAARRRLRTPARLRSGGHSRPRQAASFAASAARPPAPSTRRGR